MCQLDPNAKTGGGGLRSANSTGGRKAHFWSIQKVDGYCPDQLAFNYLSYSNGQR